MRENALIRVIHACCAIACMLAAASVSAQEVPEAENMALVGYNDLQAGSAYQPVVHEQFGRWIAYIGHHGRTNAVPTPLNPLTGSSEPNGTSILEVTDPRHPQYLAHIPGEPGLYEAGGAQMVRVCDGKTLPRGDRKAVYLLRRFGYAAHEIWNTADPSVIRSWSPASSKA